MPRHAIACALAFTPPNADNNSAASIAMMAITTSNSINVNAWGGFMRFQWIGLPQPQNSWQNNFCGMFGFEQTCLRPLGWQLIGLMLTQNDIKNALAAVKYPGYSRDIVSFGLVKEISAANGAVSVTLQLTSPNPEAAQQIKTESERVLKSMPGVNHVHVEVRQPAAGSVAPASPFANQNKVSGVKRILAIASGKGGVGKSTCSVNLACALTHLGARVGLLDCDIYGPSIPLMMGVYEKPTVNEAERLVPPSNHGVKSAEE